MNISITLEDSRWTYRRINYTGLDSGGGYGNDYRSRYIVLNFVRTAWVSRFNQNTPSQLD